MIRFATSSTLGGLDKLLVDNVRIYYVFVPETHYPGLIGADTLHAQGIDGTGVTVAVLDTGHFSHPALDKNPQGQTRVLAQYDAIADQIRSAGTTRQHS